MGPVCFRIESYSLRYEEADTRIETNGTRSSRKNAKNLRKTCGLSVPMVDHHWSRRGPRPLPHRGKWNVRRNSKANRRIGALISSGALQCGECASERGAACFRTLRNAQAGQQFSASTRDDLQLARLISRMRGADLRLREVAPLYFLAARRSRNHPNAGVGGPYA